MAVNGEGRRPNHRLRTERRLRGWSQDDVAAGLHRIAAELGEPEPGVDATMVSRWERGTRTPRPRYVRLLCRLFGLPPAQLGLVDPAFVDDAAVGALPSTREADDAVRRDFIRRIAALLGVAAVPPGFDPLGPGPWERLTHALRHPGQLQPSVIEDLERVTHALESLEPTLISSRSLLGPVAGHLEAITGLLQGSLTPSLRRRLCSLAGETAALAGWLRWDLDDLDGAAAYFRAGAEAAKEADDAALGAYLLGCLACRPPHREHPESRLRRLNGHLYGFRREHASPLTRAWLEAKEADAHAMLGRRDDCLRALDRAEAALARARSDDAGARPRFSAIDASWLAGERGASLAKLGQTAEARRSLQPVLAGMGPTTERDRLWLMTSLASTYLYDGAPEEACQVASSVLDRAIQVQLRPILQVITGDLWQRLRPYRSHPAVQRFEERVREVVERPAV